MLGASESCHGFRGARCRVWRIVPACPSCAIEVVKGARFCGACGTVLDKSSAPTETSLRSRPDDPPVAADRISSDSAERARFLPGAMLAGRYRIIALLGRGVRGVPLLPEKLRRTQKKPRPLFPPHHVRPLVYQHRKVAIRLDPAREHADLVIDTSRISPHELRDFLFQRFQKGDRKKLPRVTVTSFGFKHGMPRTADLVFDVRFLPNPHFVEGLREKTGQDAEVQAFLEEQELYKEFRKRLIDMMDFLLPAYETEGKSYLTIAVGCTGGKHRSVATALYLSDSLKESGFQVELRHRDITKK